MNPLMSPTAAATASPSTGLSDQVYVGRQPIFDRQRRTVAYQLLHRSGPDDDAGPLATRELVEHALLQWGLDQLLGGVPGHITVDASFLSSGLHLTLPADRVVLGFANDVDVEGAQKFAAIDARLAGFRVAIDDVLGRDHLPRPELLRLADILKVDIAGVPDDLLPRALDALRTQAPHATLMAEHVDELAQYRRCVDLGFDLFVGSFFEKAEVLSRASRSVSSTAAIALLMEVQRRDVSLPRLQELVEADPTLAFRMLAVVNSSAIGLAARVESVYHALVLLGVERVRQLATLVTMANRSRGNEEVLLLAATRAGMAKSLIDDPELSNAAYTAALISVLDVLFQVPMEELLAELPLADVVKDGLLDGTGPIGELLQAIDAYERVDLPLLDTLRPGELARFIRVYREAAVSAQQLRSQLLSVAS